MQQMNERLSFLFGFGFTTPVVLTTRFAAHGALSPTFVQRGAAS